MLKRKSHWIVPLALLVCPTVFASDFSDSFFSMQREVQLLSSQAPNLNPAVIKMALTAYNKLHQLGYDSQQILTVVDYSLASTTPRMWVFDLKNHSLLFKQWVAHGKNSGANLSTSFSDQPGSNKSSLGVYLTGDTYIGKHGYSLRLNGLEKGFNDKAASRNIVMHPAPYATPEFAKQVGRLGRSDGCLAVDPSVSKPLINTIKSGTVILAYYPDQSWLQHSSFLNAPNNFNIVQKQPASRI